MSPTINIYHIIIRIQNNLQYERYTVYESNDASTFNLYFDKNRWIISSTKGNEWAQLDIGMCAQNIMLAAKSLGLDSCPVGLAKFIEHTDEYNEMEVPSSEEINLAILIGYGDETPHIHERKKDNAKFIYPQEIKG